MVCLLAKVKDKKLLTMLNITVLIAGFTQGMILTFLSVMMQNNGGSLTMIGLHTTGMYVGVLFAVFFIEKLILNFGYKKNYYLAFVGLLAFLENYRVTAVRMKLKEIH